MPVGLIWLPSEQLLSGRWLLNVLPTTWAHARPNALAAV
jgi:hypothetical protein